MRISILKAIIKKDLLEVSRNKTAWVPVVVIPLVFFVVLPAFFLLLPRLTFFQSSLSSTNLDPVQVLSILPAEVKSRLAGITAEQLIPFAILGYFFAPMFLVMPLMVSSIVAAESFAGEKERKTLEGLLYSPTTDAELFTGKALAALLPAVGFSFLSFILYTIVTNTLGYPVMGRLWFPLPGWWPLIFWITPAVALLGVLVTVLVSARVATFMEAYQSGGMLVILVLGLVVGQATGIIYLGVFTGLLIGALLWVVDWLLLRVCLRLFSRKVLIGKV
jgi:ABC-type Na+ efflux pump permease subunit